MIGSEREGESEERVRRRSNRYSQIVVLSGGRLRELQSERVVNSE